jgi:short-chain fatty acids transporter
MRMSSEAEAAPQRRRSLASVSIDLFERFMPDPFILAIGLAALVALSAAAFAPAGSLNVILTSWYSGIFGILGFAFQMVLILVTGHSLAHSPPCMRALKRLVATIRTPNQAVVLTFLTAAAASWLSWGFGLVVGAVLAREVARQVRVDFAWLVAAAYSGFVIYASGPSGSIPLSQASHGNALNIVEKVTGHIVPFGQSIFAAFNLIPMIAILFVMPFVLLLVRPSGADVQVFVPPPDVPAVPVVARPRTVARKIETSPVGTIFLVLAGIGYAVVAFARGTLEFDINFIIFVFLTAGLALHRTPVAYA